LFELSNGKDTKKIFKQLYVHAVAIMRGIPKKKFNADRDTRLLCLFEHESIMRAVQGRMAADSRFKQFQEHFLFKTSKSAIGDVSGGWETFRGKDGYTLNFL
jgi:hypothetical protein